MWVLQFWFWLGEELRISFILNNPCFGGICLEDYPWLSLIVTAVFGYVLKQVWSISPIRWTVTFIARVSYSLLRSVIYFFMRHVSQKATLSSSTIVEAAKYTFKDVQAFYVLPQKALGAGKIDDTKSKDTPIVSLPHSQNN